MAAGDDGTITHRTVELSTGVRMHVAEAGPAGAPTVLLLHGFPEVWYTWRHQIPAAAGYRAVAPDMRGYGGSDVPEGGPEQYTALHVVGDLVALVDSLGEKRVFVAAHDWGAVTAWSLCLYRPDRVRALVALSVAYSPRSAARKPVDGLRALFGDEYYVCRIQVHVTILRGSLVALPPVRLLHCSVAEASEERERRSEKTSLRPLPVHFARWIENRFVLQYRLYVQTPPKATCSLLLISCIFVFKKSG